jgi:cephalosporin hydroxylase
MIEQVKLDSRMEDLLYTDPSDVNEFMAGFISSEFEVNEFEAIKEDTSSMLHSDSLCLISYLASIIEGSILEIGAYTGGATISALSGLITNESNKSNIISIEAGKFDTGKWEKPYRGYTITYETVFNVLAFNVVTYANQISPESPEKLTDRVKVIEGLSHNIWVMDEVLAEVRGDPMGLLIIDADGNVQRDLDTYFHYLKKGGYIVIDDYIIDGSDGYGKEEGSQDAVHRLIYSGVATSLGVYKWGTWVGRKIV